MEILQRLEHKGVRRMKKIISYIKALLSSSDLASHKRMLAIGSWLVLVVMVLLSAFGHQVDDTLIYVFAGLCGGQSALTVIDKMTGK